MHVLLLARRTSSTRSSDRLAGIQNNRLLVAHDIGRPGIIFRGTGKQIIEVEKAAWYPDVNVEFQGCAWADSDY